MLIANGLTELHTRTGDAELFVNKHGLVAFCRGVSAAGRTDVASCAATNDRNQNPDVDMEADYKRGFRAAISAKR